MGQPAFALEASKILTTSLHAKGYSRIVTQLFCGWLRLQFGEELLRHVFLCQVGVMFQEFL
jgi:hypothetical protein